MGRVKIREALIDDIEQLTELFNDYRLFYRKESDLVGAKTFLVERLKNKDAEIFVVELNSNKLVGFVQLYPLFSSTRMKKLWLLNDLFVNSAFRGKGYSVQLIERAKALVIESDACAMFLETEKLNIIGNKLYPKTGFELNKESNYYQWNNQ